MTEIEAIVQPDGVANYVWRGSVTFVCIHPPIPSILVSLLVSTLKRVKCPILVLHANWFRHPKYGLVGAMDDRDAALILSLVPHAQYKKIPANHVIHTFEPEQFVCSVVSFTSQLEKG